MAGSEALQRILSEAYEIVDDEVYFAPVPESVRTSSTRTEQFLSIEPWLSYEAFFADFGPLPLGTIVRFCRKLDEERSVSARTPGVGGSENIRRIYVVCDEHPHHVSIGMLLVCAYQIFRLSRTPPEAYAPFIGMEPPPIPFRDAAFAVCTYAVSVLDCTRAMYRAVRCGHFRYDTFNVDSFEHLAKVENGDVSWIVPDKFIAFSGPLPRRRQLDNDKYTFIAEDYVPLFRELGVSCIVRFNKRIYNKRRFTDAGFRHVDLYYEDGGNPPEAILRKFLQVCEQERGAIAVHCKAGLGRTGTNIALYMMKHYGYTANETMAWSRICRPGMIVGPQQQFVAHLEARMWREGMAMRNQLQDAPSEGRQSDQAALMVSRKPRREQQDGRARKARTDLELQQRQQPPESDLQIQQQQHRADHHHSHQQQGQQQAQRRHSMRERVSSSLAATTGSGQARGRASANLKRPGSGAAGNSGYSRGARPSSASYGSTAGQRVAGGGAGGGGTGRSHQELAASSGNNQQANGQAGSNRGLVARLRAQTHQRPPRSNENSASGSGRSGTAKSRAGASGSNSNSASGHMRSGGRYSGGNAVADTRGQRAGSRGGTANRYW